MGAGNRNISELVEQLFAGQLVIPSIQRNYVWKVNQIPPLLESIYRDYPIGSILIWETKNPIPLKLAAVVQAQTSQYIPMVLLDGQQRLTSLAWVWKPESKIDKTPIDMRFDVSKETFKNARKSDAGNKLLFPVKDLLGKELNLVGILENAGIPTNHSMFNVYLGRLNKLNTAFRNFQIPVMTFTSEDYEEVADVFARVNQGGRRLSKGDLINSAIAARWPEGLEAIEKYTNELKAQNFDLGTETPLRLMSLIAGKGGKYIKLLDKDMQSEALQKAWAETEEALSYGVDFLKNDCNIEASSLLTSLNIVIVPGFFRLHAKKLGQDLNIDQLIALRRWVYSVMAFGSYNSAIDGSLESEIKFIREKSFDEALVLLRKRAFRNFPLEGFISPKDLEGKNSASGLFNLLFIAALQSHAKDWKTPVSIQLKPMSSGMKIEYHHVFPRAKMVNIADKDQWNSLANLAFITAETNKAISDRLPSEYVPNLKIDADRFKEQLIPTEPRLLEIGSFSSFLEARRALQARKINEMLGLEGNQPASLAMLDDEEVSSPDELQDQPAFSSDDEN